MDLNRIDAWVASRVKKSCRQYPDANADFKDLVHRGWSYTTSLGIYVDALVGRRHDDPYVDVPPDSMHHKVLSVFVFGKANPMLDLVNDDGLRIRDIGVPGAALYRTRRLNGVKKLSVHPALLAYVNRLNQIGGAPQLKCIKGKGKEGSVVFTVACVKDLAPDCRSFCDNLYSGQTMCGGTLGWLKQRHAADSLLKINQDGSDTADELEANKKVHGWMSRRHFLQMTSLHSLSSYILGTSSIDRNVKTHMIVLNRMQGDVSRLSLSAAEIADIAKTVLIVLNVIHEHDHLHLDVKPKNVLYTKPVDGGPTKFALADFGILESMRKVYVDLQDGNYSGTYNFMSPLLLDYKDDEKNEVYPVFRRVAKECRGIDYSSTELADMFQSEKKLLRDKAVMPKVDMQSLGLTLFDLLNVNGHITGAARKELVRFIDGLLFLDKGFTNSYQALRHLCSLNDCSDIDIVGSHK